MWYWSAAVIIMTGGVCFLRSSITCPIFVEHDIPGTPQGSVFLLFTFAATIHWNKLNIWWIEI